MDWYSGKKDNAVSIPINDYTYVDPTRWERPDPWEGTCRYIMYLNLDLSLKKDYLTGVIRIRAVREPSEDATAYRDITVSRKNCKLTTSDLDSDSGLFEWLVWVEWMGGADEDFDRLRWDIKVGPEFAKAQMTTRYAKSFLV